MIFNAVTAVTLAPTAVSASYSALQAETRLLIQLSFYAALLFLVLYTIRTAWWHTVHGRTLAALAAAFIIVMLRVMLVYWHLLGSPDKAPDALDWGSTSCLLLAPLAFLTMSWQLARKPVRRWAAKLRPRHPAPGDDPLGPGAPEKKLSEYPERNPRHSQD
jgi:hypothetical protein